MINNYFILKAQSKYLNTELINHSIEDSLIVGKNLVTLILKSTRYRYLKILLEKNLETVFIDELSAVPQKNVLSIFPSIKSKLVLSVSIVEKNRVLTLQLSDDYSLVFFAVPNKSNIFIVKEGIILDSYKDKNDFIGKNLESLINSHQASLNSSPKDYEDLFKNKYYYIGKYYKYELEKEFSKADISTIEYDKIIADFVSKIDNSINYYIYSNNDVLIPTLINLTAFSDINKLEFENINSLIVNYCRMYRSLNRKNESKNKLISKLNSDLKRIEKKIENLEKAISETNNSQLYKMFGDILLANVYDINSSNGFYDYKDESNITHKIKLNPKLSAQENASHYYSKYKGLKNSTESLNNKLLLFIAERKSIIDKLDNIEKEDNIKLLKKMENAETNKVNQEKLPFRIFKVSDMLEVWVGKDSASNDLLTMKYTNNYDYWFHVRGFSGSHTILKLLDKNKKPEKEFIIKAAEICAYYSKARKGKHVPVAYTEKKYVKKRKGFKQGTVVMEKEKIVFVNPGIPEE